MKYKLVNPDFRKDYAKQLLDYRGITDIDKYINPTSDCLISCQKLDNIEYGFSLFIDAVLESPLGIDIVVDCDVDGFTSAAIMYSYIKKLNPDKSIRYFLHKGKQHGLEDCVEQIIEVSDMTDLVILPDSSSNDKIYHDRLKEVGIKCLVLDHHITDEPISDNAIIINNQLSEDYENKYLTGAGVAWKFCSYVDSKMNTSYAKDLIDLAAWGIIGDMGSLLSLENRYIIKTGLENIKNYFFQTLIEKQSFSMKGEITPITVAFYIVPLVNAMIRVGTMEEKERLFLAFIDGHQMVPCNKRGAKGTFEKVAIESARECTNARTRQNKIKEDTVKKLEIKIHKYGLLDNKILFIKLEEDDDFPPELNGLVAMELSSKFKKPTIVARLNDHGYVRGSMRGIGESELKSFKSFLDSAELFEYVSGHDNAAGVSILDNDIYNLHEYANKELADIDFGESVFEVNFARTAEEIDIADIVSDIYDYRFLYGQDLSEPLIYVGNINLLPNDIQIIGKNQDTCKFAKNGVEYIQFHAKKLIEDLSNYNYINMEIVGRMAINNFAGRSTPQIIIESYEIHDGRLAF